MTLTAADANRLNLAYWEETTYGTAPTGNPTLKDLRLTSESLKQSTTSILSNELRSDRQRSDLIRTGIEAQGSIGIELSNDSNHLLFMHRYGLMNTGALASGTVTASTISFGAASGTDQVITDSGSGFGSIAVYDWVYITGAASAANNGIFKVTAAAAGSITVQNPNGVSATAGASITVDYSRPIYNGTTLKTIYLEKEYTDLSNEFAYYTGMAVNQFSVNASLQSIVTGNFDFLGKNEVSASATLGDGSNTAAGTDQILNGIDHIVAIRDGHTDKSVTEFSFTVNNNLRNRMVLGEVGPLGIGLGSIEVTGSMTKYFESKTLMDKYLNWTDTNLGFILQDDANQWMAFDFPRVKFTDGQRVAGGIDSDIMAELQWTAYMDATQLKTLGIAYGS